MNKVIIMLIGFSGCKNVGKDTLSDYLVEKYNFIKYSYATPLKDACKILFLLTEDQLYDQNKKEEIDERWGLSPRQMFQIVGTDFFREKINKDFWIQHFKYWYSINKDKNIVVVDCRFQNEIDLIKELNGITIKIERNTNIIDNHISESGIMSLSNFDYIIDNNSSKFKSKKKLDEIINLNE